MFAFILTLVCLISFVFVLYIPTILFYNGSETKGREDHILLFLGGSLLFIVFDYLCVLFYDIKAVTQLVECSSRAFNFNCFFGDYLSRLITPSIPLFLIFLIQFLAMIFYAYITVRFVLKSKKSDKVVLILFVFFITSLLGTGLHYVVLHDVLFDGIASIISLVGSNCYITLPFVYLVVMTLMNINQLKIEKRKNK